MSGFDGAHHKLHANGFGWPHHKLIRLTGGGSFLIRVIRSPPALGGPGPGMIGYHV